MAWEKFMNVTQCILKNKPDLPLSKYMYELFSKYCNIDDSEEYVYLYVSVLNVVCFTNCDNEVESNTNESWVLDILACDYTDRICKNRNF